jgi:phenylpropionate dioxygenase-like ring-hydroxylating dioxygenase large terminal subunit
VAKTVRSPIPLEEFAASTLDPSEAIGLPPAVYTDAEFHEFEIDAIFRSRWHCVGRVEMIPEPGDFFTTTLMDREPVIVSRTSTGSVNVMTSVCQHRAMCITAPVQRPRAEWFEPPPDVKGNTRTFRCPYHWWTYDLDGRLLGAPSMDRTVGFAKADHALPRLRVEEWCGFIFANLDAEARPLREGTHKLDAVLSTYRLNEWVTQAPEVIRDVPFNWKIMVENFMESYHNYGLHNALLSMEAYGEGNAGDAGKRLPFEPGDDVIFGVGRSNVPDAAVNATQRAFFAPLPTLTVDERQNVIFAWVAPTLLLGVFSDSAFWFTVEPTGPSAHTLSMGYMFPAGADDNKLFPALLERYGKGIELFNNQDLPADVAIQVGMRSQFAPRGRMSHLESFLPKFNSWLLACYRAAQGVPVG